MPWAIREATMASAVVVLSIRSALVFDLRQMCRSDWRCRARSAPGFTSPWKGEGGPRQRVGRGGQRFRTRRLAVTPPRIAYGDPTLPLQGRVVDVMALPKIAMKKVQNVSIVSPCRLNPWPRSSGRPGCLRSGDIYAPLSYPHLRRAARREYRFHGPPAGMVSPHPRPWRGGVLRPARPQCAVPDCC